MDALVFIKSFEKTNATFDFFDERELLRAGFFHFIVVVVVVALLLLLLLLLLNTRIGLLIIYNCQCLAWKDDKCHLLSANDQRYEQYPTIAFTNLVWISGWNFCIQPGKLWVLGGFVIRLLMRVSGINGPILKYSQIRIGGARTMPRHEIDRERDNIKSVHRMAVKYSELFTNLLFTLPNDQNIITSQLEGRWKTHS
jgi:hypothetical protein